MKKALALAVLAAVVVTAAFGVTGCGKGQEATVEKKVEKSSEQYACSMKCEGDKTYPKPGDCPVCEMPLEKV